MDTRHTLARSLRAGGWLLGLLQQDPAGWFEQKVRSSAAADGLTPAEIDAKLAERERLRKARDFKAADGIRDELARAGIAIEDGAGGTRWRRS
jgi:cysteinyl-tRNA synthetase